MDGKSLKMILSSALFLACEGVCFGQLGWTPVASGTGNDLNSIICPDVCPNVCPNWFVAVGDAGTILTSYNGWAATNSGTIANLKSVVYKNPNNGNLYVAVGYGTILTSWDSFNWYTKISETKDSLTSVAPYGSGFVAVGNGVILTSTDATDSTTWIVRDSGAIAKGLNSVTYDYPFGFCLLAVGRGGRILNSRDGATWTIRNSGTTNNLNSIIISGNFIVVVGDSGTILTSTDGTTWTKVNSGTTKRLNFVGLGLDLLVAVGDSGTILTSYNAKGWLKENSGTTKRLNSVAYGRSNFDLIAVGDSGTILKRYYSEGVVQRSSNKANYKKIRINLANNCIYATLPFATSSTQLKVELFTISGKRTYSASTDHLNGDISVPVYGFPSAMYYLSITDGANSLSSGRFVLVR